MDFAHTFSKNYRFFFVFFNKDYTFYTKNLFIRPKNCVQSILYTENLFIRPKIGFKAFFTAKDTKSFVKIYFLVTFLHF